MKTKKVEKPIVKGIIKGGTIIKDEPKKEITFSKHTGQLCPCR